MTLTRPRLAVVGVLCLVALSGCGGHGAASSSAASGGGQLSRAAALPAARPGDTGNGNAADAYDQGAGSGEVVQQSIIRHGSISIRTAEPQRARDHVDVLLTRLRGSVDDEQTVYDAHGKIKESSLVLRVPVASFTSAMHRLEQLGTVVHSSSTGKDVSSQVIDVQQRLKTLRISLRDLNSFQRQAANIDQLLRFENAITQRRGEYQSLKAQRNHLLNETSMSTIELDISVPPEVLAPPHHHHAGFVTGLRHGWSAFTRTVLVTLTGVGAALPFAVLLAVVGLPVWWWGRRTWRTGRPATPVETPPSE
ncbi:MAG: DUF4349 domain-containing protein [Nocardioides sp.]